MAHTSPLAGRRIAHVSSAHPCTDNRVHYREAQTLAEAGAEVHLVACADDCSSMQSDVIVHQMVRYGRAKRPTVGVVRAVRTALATDAEVLHLHDPELATAIPWIKRAGRLVIFDAHEDLPEQVLGKEYIPAVMRKPVSKIARMIVRLAGTADLVVAATSRIASTYPKHKVVTVKNYPRLRVEEETSLPINDRPRRIAYIGALSAVRGSHEMISALGCSEFPEDWRLTMAGSGLQELFSTMEKNAGWSRVDYRGRVSPDEARDILLGSRVGILPFSDIPGHRDALPTKMFEYFAAGIPVIASDFPLWREIVEKRQCGLLVDQADPRDIARAVKFYAQHPKVLEEHSRNARKAATAELNWDSQGEVLVEAYSRLLRER